MAAPTLNTPVSDRKGIPNFPCRAFAITPAATDLSATYQDGVTVMTKTEGTVVVTPLQQGDDITLSNVPAYFVLPFRVKAVKSGTTASCVGIV